MAATRLTDFFAGTTKRFRISVVLAGLAPDLTADTVTLTLLGTSTPASELVKEADVLTEGASGSALFELSPIETGTLTPGPHWAEIVWERNNGDVHVLYSAGLAVKKRIGD